MGCLSDEFSGAIAAIGMKKLEHPIFYHAPIALRFEIGGSEDIFIAGDRTKKRANNPEYISVACHRAHTIYTSLPCRFNILRFDCLPDEGDVHKLADFFCRRVGLPLPDERIMERIPAGDEDDETIPRLQWYWNIEEHPFHPDILLKEITRADFGGRSELVSSVYFMDSRNAVLFHLYDDRGADLAAACRETIYPVYVKLNDWILDFDRGKMDATFAK